MAPLPELGEPDKNFHNLWVDYDDEEAERLPPHPGFHKWTVRKPHGRKKARAWREFRCSIPGAGPNSFYCHQAQVRFTGRLRDGTQFVSSRENGIPLMFILGQEDVMHGFNFAVSSMLPGEKAVFTIPTELAVTKTGSPASIPSNIPSNQTLWFKIELINLFTVTDIFEDEGILKKTVKIGVPERRQIHWNDVDSVFVKYNACLKDGTSVSKSEGLKFRLADGMDAFFSPFSFFHSDLKTIYVSIYYRIRILIDLINTGFFCPVFAHAVKTMKEGEEAILTVKPKYAFGALGRPSLGGEAIVPPDATIYVYLQFVSWTRHARDDWIISKNDLSIGNFQTIYTQNQAQALVKGGIINGPDEAVMTSEVGEIASVVSSHHPSMQSVLSDQISRGLHFTLSIVLRIINAINLLTVLNAVCLLASSLATKAPYILHVQC
uniref:peptidylprolyl isomerase n=1 Tax=Oryza nivara TaxID=4536 RepID=A0A0E0FN98_ORYNI